MRLNFLSARIFATRFLGFLRGGIDFFVPPPGQTSEDRTLFVDGELRIRLVGQELREDDVDGELRLSFVEQTPIRRAVVGREFRISRPSAELRSAAVVGD